MKNIALLVIDVQNSFFKTHYWQQDQFESFHPPMLRLIEQCMAHNVPIVQILHAEPGNESSVFNPRTGLVEAMEFLPDCFAACFTKQVHNAFTDTELAHWLKENGIQRLLISGIRTEQCCETTTRVGHDLGFDMTFLIDATLTFDMQDHQGQTVTADEIKKRTRLVLEHRFARVMTVDELKFTG